MLTENETIYRVVSFSSFSRNTALPTHSKQDFETGFKEKITFMVKDKGFKISQVYPIRTDSTDKMVCLATRTAALPESIADVVEDSDSDGNIGVDYFIGEFDFCLNMF